MSATSHVTLRWPTFAGAAVVLLAAGAGSAYLVLQRPASPGQPGQGGAGPAHTPAAGVAPPARDASAGTDPNAPRGPLPDVVVKLSPAALQRAGIELAVVTRGGGAPTVRIPGTVEPDAYKQVAVTSVAPGRVTRVLAELGQRVRRGDTLAQIFSPELADAETSYLSVRAELAAHERELGRTESLFSLGAASRQELERLHAEHAAKLASVQSLASRLALLGMPPASIDALLPGAAVEATVDVPAPIDGVVTERAANPGLNVDPTAKLFTVVDLSSVWVVGALFERDFARVRVGDAATVTTTAYAGVVWRGRVSYIDPQVSAETRTARVRVEVPDPRHDLRLGMYVNVEVATTNTAESVRVPRSAVQNVSDRQVVYVANRAEPGTFTEREVRLGNASGEGVEVLQGVQPGDEVVSSGSFSVRAERERLGGR